MRVLIIESRRPLAELWKRHIECQSAEVFVATSTAAAIEMVRENEIDVIILDLILEEGSAMAIADYACYRRPEARVIYVTSTTFFSDGSVFEHMPNACGYVQTSTPPDDLAAMVEHLGPR
ncbi:response regulator [Cognatishimia sp. MH4019]|uniref:response regulator n=1 Tax=Cognatishimia sp. MH4019 TaxID=2854030 RepID=UPI001CD3B4D9|nr:response regulator [Cognatishimia sp. MH4019]